MSSSLQDLGDEPEGVAVAWEEEVGRVCMWKLGCYLLPFLAAPWNCSPFLLGKGPFSLQSLSFLSTSYLSPLPLLPFFCLLIGTW